MATARAEAVAEAGAGAVAVAGAGAGAGAAARPGGGSRHAACAAACSKRPPPPPPPPQAPQSPAAGRQEKMAVCKKLVNSPDACVDEMLAGVAAAFPGLDLHAAHRVLLRKQDVPRNKVGILSGGGSGHEPFCAGFVGRGMLGAAVAGSVFASPPPSHVLYAIRCLAEQGASGVLAVVANYTGDCLNFGLAVERARALGLAVEAVVVGEDCALLDRGGGAGGAGRRGLCGLLFVYKLAGALAEAGASLEAVAERARQVTARMATLGVCLSPCSLPGAGPLFTLGPDEMELGLGVHGEEGAFRLKLSSAHEVAEAMVARLAGALALAPGARVAALLNNLGGTSQLEQALMGGELRAALERRGVAVERLYAGHLMTSLEMAGVQLSVLRLPEEEAEAAAWLAALDEPTDAGAWPGCPLALPCALPPTPAPQELAHDEEGAGPELPAAAAQRLLRCVEAAAQALRKAESRCNLLDSGCGDGDCGSTLRRLADEAWGAARAGALREARPARLLAWLSEAAERVMGGTSGAVYSLLLARAARSLAQEPSALDADAWARAWRASLYGLAHYSTARPGDRTLRNRRITRYKPKSRPSEDVPIYRAVHPSLKRNCTLRSSPLQSGSAKNSHYHLFVQAGRPGARVQGVRGGAQEGLGGREGRAALRGRRRCQGLRRHQGHGAQGGARVLRGPPARAGRGRRGVRGRCVDSRRGGGAVQRLVDATALHRIPSSYLCTMWTHLVLNSCNLYVIIRSKMLVFRWQVLSFRVTKRTALPEKLCYLPRLYFCNFWCTV